MICLTNFIKNYLHCLLFVIIIRISRNQSSSKSSSSRILLSFSSYLQYVGNAKQELIQEVVDPILRMFGNSLLPLERIGSSVGKTSTSFCCANHFHVSSLQLRDRRGLKWQSVEWIINKSSPAQASRCVLPCMCLPMLLSEQLFLWKGTNAGK